MDAVCSLTQIAARNSLGMPLFAPKLAAAHRPRSRVLQPQLAPEQKPFSAISGGLGTQERGHNKAGGTNTLREGPVFPAGSGSPED